MPRGLQIDTSYNFEQETPILSFHNYMIATGKTTEDVRPVYDERLVKQEKQNYLLFCYDNGYSPDARVLEM